MANDNFQLLPQLAALIDAWNEIALSAEEKDVALPGGGARPTNAKAMAEFFQELGDRLPIKSFDTVEEAMASSEVAVGDEFRVRPTQQGVGGQRWIKGVDGPEFLNTETTAEEVDGVRSRVERVEGVSAQRLLTETDFAWVDMDEAGRVFGGGLEDGTICYLQTQHGAPNDGLMYKYNQLTQRLEVYKVNGGAYELFEDIAYVDVEGTEFEDCNEIRRDPAGNIFWAQKNDGTTLSVGGGGVGGSSGGPIIIGQVSGEHIEFRPDGKGGVDVYKNGRELVYSFALVDATQTPFEGYASVEMDPGKRVFTAVDGAGQRHDIEDKDNPLQPLAKSNAYSFYTMGGRVFSSNLDGTKRLDLGPGSNPGLASPDHVKWTGPDDLDYFAELGSPEVHPMVAKLRLAVHGDSQYTSTFVDPLSRMLGIPVHGCVQSGLPTASMAARAGWVPMMLRVDNGEIPAEGPVNCQHLNPPFRVWSKEIAGPRNVTINGVHGVLRKYGDDSNTGDGEGVPEFPDDEESDADASTYTFFRDAPGEAVPCEYAGVPVVFDLIPGYGDTNDGQVLEDRDELLQLCAGGGNNRGSTQLIFDTHKAADVFTKARVRGNLFGSWIIHKNQAENGEFAANRALRAMMTDYFGVRHIDSYLVLQKAVRNEDDQAEVDVGLIPSWVYRSSENIHLDNIGRVFLAAEYARRYVYLGYVPDIDDATLDARIATEMANYGWTLPVPEPLYTREQVMALRTE